MLSEMLKEHNLNQQQHKANQEKLARQSNEATQRFITALVDELNRDASDAYANQRKLELETKNLLTATQNFSRQAQQWIKVTDNFHSALKELGDVQNWSRSIENDMRIISASLEYVYKEKLAARKMTPAGFAES